MSRLILALGLLTTTAAAQVPTVSYTRPDATFEEPFTSLRGVRELADGRVIVSDIRDKVLQILDFKTGTAVAIGREGKGPGEWGLPATLVALPAGQTLLQDLGNMRYLIIGADGRPIRAVSLPRPGGEHAQGGFSLGSMLFDLRGSDAQGRIYFQGSTMPSEAVGPDSVPVIRWDLKDKVDTAGWVPITHENRPAVTRSSGTMTVRMGAQRAWPAEVQWAPAADGRLAMGRPEPYRMDWVAPAGTRAGPVIPYAPITVSEAEKKAFRERRAQATPVMITMGGPGGGTGGATSMPSGPTEDPEWPETMPPFTGRDAVRVTPEGEAWVTRTTKGANPTPAYDVFDGTGKLVRRVTLQPGSRIVGFGKETVYLVRLDEDDLQYLERHRR